VLVSGAGEVNLTWATVFDALSERGRVIAYDRAGLGDSDPLDLVTGSAEVDDLTALLDVVGPAVLVGHSWGGPLAQLAAWTRPDQVSGLVLVDPTHENLEVPARYRMAAAAMFLGVGVLHRLHLADRVLRGMGSTLAEAASDEPVLREQIVSAYASGYAARSQFHMVAAENRLADRCGEWVGPQRAGASWPDAPLVVLAATQKPAWLRDQSLRLHRTVVAAAPRGQYVEVDSGHYIQREHPDAVVEAVDHVLEA